MQGTSWADRLELVGDDDRLVGFAGALPIRLLAERTGLRAGLSTAMARRGFDPVYDRGQVLIDMAVTQVLGGEAISDFQGMRHLGPVTGPVASTSTVWRALSEVGDLQLARLNTAVTAFRRHWWALLAQRREGFPWLTVAGRELTGIMVVDLDASVVFAASDKENAQPTYKDGVGFSHDLLEHIAAGGGVQGRSWEFSVGWSCTDTEMDAIARLSTGAWTPWNRPER